MHCWEFHHAVEAGAASWFWRCMDKDGHVHSECRRHFDTFMKAFADAKVHGFDEEAHPWYLATRTEQPCVKVIEDLPGKRGPKKAA